MLFDVYGPTAMYQWLGWVAVFVCLILANEVARRSKAGGIFCFLILWILWRFRYRDWLLLQCSDCVFNGFCHCIDFCLFRDALVIFDRFDGRRHR